MISSRWIRRVFAGRQVAFASALIAGLYLIRHIDVQALQIPAYLLVVAYDVVEAVLPVLAPFHPVLFPVFLYLVAVAAAGVTRRLGQHVDDGSLMRAAGGVSVLIGTLAFLYGVAIGGPLVAPVDNPTPLATLLVTAGMSLLVGWWLLGRSLDLQALRHPT